MADAWAPQGDGSEVDVLLDLREGHGPRSARTRVVVVDDHKLLAEMLVERLGESGFEAMTTDVFDDALVERVRGLHPDVLLLDAVFHDDEDAGLRVLHELTGHGGGDGEGERPACTMEIVVLTGVADEIRHAEFLDGGAVAVISKGDSFDGVVGKVQDVIAGIDPLGVTRRQHLAQCLTLHRAEQAGESGVFGELTNRERATLQALVDGRSVDEIAVDRTVASSTVRSQVRAVLRKLGAHSQIEVVAFAARHGMRPDEPCVV